MRLFLDTEFTDFIDTQLISIGLVAEDGREFYAELTDFDRSKCSVFVYEVVFPLLGQYPSSFVGTKQRVAEVLYEWLSEYKDEGCDICVDYHTDWDLTVDLLSMLRGTDISFIHGKMIWTDLDQQKIEQFWQDTGFPRHMALYDARANKFGYDPSNGYGE